MWRSNVPLKNKVNKMNALVWKKGRWSLHLFPLLPALRRSIDGSQARFLRRILKIPAAYISRISHATVRRRCSTFRFSTFIFRSQLRWLGHILRKHPQHPLRLVLFQPHTDRAAPQPTIVSRTRFVVAPISIGDKNFFERFIVTAARPAAKFTS